MTMHGDRKKNLQDKEDEYFAHVIQLPSCIQSSINARENPIFLLHSQIAHARYVMIAVSNR